MIPDLRFHEAVVPPIALFIILICLVIVVIRSYRSEEIGRLRKGIRAALSGLRVLALGAIFFILLKPVWFRLKQTVEPGRVIVLVDASESMEISDAPGRRLEVARSAGRELADALGKQFQVRCFGFAAFPEAVPIEELDAVDVRVTGATNIGGSIEEAVQAEGGEVAAVVLLSDGQHNTGPSPQEAAGRLRQRSIPVFTVGIGAESRYRDLELREFSGPRTVFRGEDAHLSIRVVNYGFDAEEMPFRLRIAEHRPSVEGAPVDPRSGKAVVESLLPLPPPGIEQRHAVDFVPESEGVYRLEAEVGPFEDEEVTENNRRELEIEVSRERLRVLFVEATPRWEYGFILRALRTDRRFAAAGLIQLQNGAYRYQGTELNPESPWGNRFHVPPLSPDWSRMDAVILGDVPAGDFQLAALEGLRAAIEDRGLILVVLPGMSTSRAGGLEGTPLGPLLPFRGLREPVAGPIQVRPSAAGLSHPAMRVGAPEAPVATAWEKLAPLWGLYPVREVVPASVLLAEAELRGVVHPVMAFRRAGAGKVLELAVDDTWRWRAVPAAQGTVGGVPSTFWRQMVRWLITGRIDDPGGGLRLLVEKSTFNRGERVDIEARLDVAPRLEGAPVRLAAEILGPDGVSQPVTMTEVSRSGEGAEGIQVYRHSVVPLLYGAYQVRAIASSREETVGRDELSFFVAESGLERARASLDRQTLEDLARTTGGRHFDAKDYGKVADAVPERNTIRVEPVTTRIWDHPLVFLLFAAAVSLEWAVRRWNDLI